MAIMSAAWKLTKKHYELILGIAVVSLIIGVAIQMTPFLRYLLPLPMTMLGAGSMYIFRELTEGRPAKFGDVFRAFQDSRWMTALMPLAVTGVGFTLAQAGLAKAVDGGGAFGLLISILSFSISIVWGIMVAFSIPLIIFKDKTFVETIDLNLRAIKLNWKPILMWWICLFGVIFISLICLVLPFIFIGLPVVMASGYFAYAVNFEGLNVPAAVERLKER